MSPRLETAVSRLGDLLDATLTREPGRPAIRTREATISYAELDARVRSLSAELAARGVRRGDRVGLLAPNGAAFVVGGLAIHRLGAAMAALPIHAGPQDVDGILARLRVKGIVRVASPTTPPTPELRTGFVVTLHGSGRFESRPGDPASSPEPVLATPAAPPCGATEADEALVLVSSGTTGRPKLIGLSHDRVLWGIRAWLAAWEFATPPSVLMAAPFFHVVYAPLVLGTLAIGGTVIIPERLDARAITRAIPEFGVTTLMATPALLAQLLSLHDPALLESRTLDTVIFGAAPMPLPTLRALRAGRPATRLFNCYGLTETASAVSCLDRAAMDANEASVGRPHPGVRVTIRDEAGMPLPPGVIGELHVAGPNVIDRYLDDPALDARSFRNGEFRTGDAGFLDDEGFVHLVGRTDDRINVAGEKIYPSAIENVLLQHPDVFDAVALGIEDPGKGQVVHAHLVPKAGRSLDLAELRRFCARALPPAFVPRRFAEHKSLPRNPGGKLMRSLLSTPPAEGSGPPDLGPPDMLPPR